MTKLDDQKETCPCHVCKSDLAYIAPCERPEEEEEPPLPFMIAA